MRPGEKVLIRSLRLPTLNTGAHTHTQQGVRRRRRRRRRRRVRRRRRRRRRRPSSGTYQHTWPQRPPAPPQNRVMKEGPECHCMVHELPILLVGFAPRTIFSPSAVPSSPQRPELGRTSTVRFPEHQEVHVCDLLRERCTGFPCDERRHERRGESSPPNRFRV